MKKIIFIMSRMSIGGAQKSLVNAVQQIDPKKFDITLYVRENKTQLIDEIPSYVRIVVNTDNNKKFYYYPSVMLWTVVGKLSEVTKVKRLAEYSKEKETERVVRLKARSEKRHYDELNEDYDILISYLQGYTCKFAADTVKAKRKICFYHNSTDGTPSIHREYLPKYDEIITVSEECRKFLAGRYSELSQRIHVIENIMNLEKIQDLAVQENLDLEKEKIILCTCGRMSREKGYEFALDAAAILKSEGIRFHWIFVGDGPLKESIDRRIMEENLSDVVTAVGVKSNPYPYMHTCDIYVQPSREEAQPLSIMEAQILHKPVVSTKTFGAQGLLVEGETGLLTDFSGEDLAKHLIALIKDEALKKQMEENVAKIDYKKYNDVCRAKWEKLLEEDA